MILLDTHILIWWVGMEGNKLSRAARSSIDEAAAETQVLVSAVSTWEIAVLRRRGRIGLEIDVTTWLADVERAYNIGWIALDSRMAAASVELPGEFHNDPADRFLVATSRQLDVPLVTADKKIRDYPHVRTIW